MCAPSWTAWLHPRRRCKPVEPKACTTQRSVDCFVYGGCCLIAVDSACRGRQHSVRLKDADIIVLVRERTQITRQLVEKLPRLKLIAQTGKIGSHIDVAACTERGIAVAEGIGSPVAPAELTWALVMAAMRRLPQYISNLKHGATSM